MNYSAIPNNKVPIQTKGIIERTWFQFLSDLWTGRPISGVQPQTLTTSPFVFKADTRGFMIVQGGTVTLVQFSRDGVTNYNTGQTSGTFPMAMGDKLIVIYSSNPSITWVPL